MNKMLIASLLATPLLLSACNTTETEEVTYDQDSWKTVLEDSCTSFFDGCNNCNRAEGSDIAACTRMFCDKYEKPTCLDAE